MNLRHLQQTFCRAIVQPETELQFLPYVLQQDQLSSTQRLAIYRNNKDSSILKILQSHYPVCSRLVGDKFFAGMANAYSTQTPSTYPDLNNYGRTFPQFIRDFPSAQSLPYLPEVAKLEWAWLQAFYGSDLFATLDIERIAKIDTEQAQDIVFQLPANATLLTSPYPIDQIWQVNQPDAGGDETVELNDGGVCLIVWRKQWQVRIDYLDQTEWQLLQAFNNGLSLAAVCQEASAQAIDVSEYLPKLVNCGWITDFM